MVISGLGSLLVERQTTATPQYKDESNASNLLAIHGTFCGLAILSVLLRLYVRIFMLKSIGIDDYIIVAAAVSAPGYQLPLTLIPTGSRLTLIVFRSFRSRSSSVLRGNLRPVVWVGIPASSPYPTGKISCTGGSSIP